MSSDEAPASTCPFPTTRRIISTHDPQTGKAVFSDVFDEQPPVGLMPKPEGGEPWRNINVYSTSTMPVSGLSPSSAVRSEADANLELKAYAHDLKNPTPPDGSHPTKTQCRVIEMPPGTEAAMHRTVTLDYAIVVDGTVELELDSGETRILKKGDVIIQRGTAHAWKNVTPPDDNRGWLKMFFVMLSSEKVNVKEGRELAYGFGLPRLGDSAKSPR